MAGPAATGRADRLCPPWAWTLQVVTPQGPSDGNSPASDFLPEMSLKLPPGTSST